MIPDGEKLVATHLRADPAIDARVVGKTPDSITTAWVRVTELDAQDDTVSGIEHLVTFLFQLDCYAGEAGGQPEAKALVRSVRASLKAMQAASVTGVQVTAVRFAGQARIPDVDFEPARERVVLTAMVTTHP